VSRAPRDPIRLFGNVLLVLGVAVWGVYAIVRFGMGWDVTAGQFLPYHLAGVVPGFILRRRQIIRRLARRLFFVALLPTALLGCGESGREQPQGTAPLRASAQPLRATRAIEPPAGEISTAGLTRVQIEAETRTVLAAQARVVLHWHQPVSLAGDVVASSDLPESLQTAAALLVEAWVSVQDPGARGKTPLELRARDAGRQTLRAAPQLVTGAPRTRVTAAVPIPDAEALRGLEGMLNVVARPLPDAETLVQETRVFEIGAADHLVFGYGVEEEGWSPGWPPVRFHVEARIQGSPVATRIPLFERRIDPAADPRDRRWFDASLSLRALAGKRVRFAFETEALEPISGTDLARSFPVVSNPEVVPGPMRAGRESRLSAVPGAPPRPNIVLISLDTLRAQSVSAYGYARETTPNLDRRLVAQGTMNRTAVTPFPYTPPAHMSMLTGLDVCAHGVEDRHGVLAPDRIILAEALRAAGYRTAAFTENAYVVAGAGFARGFDTYFELLDEEHAAPGFGAETFERAERWLSTVDTRPFFLFIHTYQVHEPYTPPRGYQSLFEDDLSQEYTAENRKAVTDYDREIRYTDDLLGGFLDALDTGGLAGTTIAVVTSDHGEQFGEHFWAGHGFDTHDEALLVPLVIRAPGLVAAGRVVEPPVSLMDIPPTLLELTGLDPIPDIQGRSFADLLLATPVAGLAAFQERPLVSRTAFNESVRTRRYKYLRETGKKVGPKLYDLSTDPGEHRNVASSHPDVLAETRAALTRHTEACEAWRRSHPPEETAAVRGQRQPGWLINRDEIERKLRSLGYVE
jgi:arylsulfatase A-like enzyme